MSNMDGWVKLHRRIIDSKVFANEEILKLWLLCLCNANHEDTWVDINGEKDPVLVKRGHFITGRYSLHRQYYPRSRKKNKSAITLWRWMEKLKKWEKLNIKTNNKYSLIEVINYEKYQQSNNDDQKSDQQVISRRSAGDQQVNTNNNDKNDKNDKNNTARAREESTGIVERINSAKDIETLTGIWREYRKSMNIHDNAFTLDVQQSEFRKLGLARVKVAMLHSIENGWKKLVEPENKSGEEMGTDYTGRAAAAAYKEYTGW